MARKKFGRENPTTLTTWRTRSVQPPRMAAVIPNTMLIRAVTMIPTTTSEKLTGNRSATVVATDRPV